MMTRRLFCGLALMLSFWIYSAVPAMAQGVGAIGGTVADASGAVLPGVNLSLTSSQGGTLGGSQETVSDARGAYQFLRLVPGTYIVKAQLAGFRTVEQRGIVVACSGEPLQGEIGSARGKLFRGDRFGESLRAAV